MNTYIDQELIMNGSVTSTSLSHMHFFTIGVYGSTKEEFYEELVTHHIDTFCDIRRRRAVRGKQYSFANSNQLQAGLKEHNIQYLHIIDLAPTLEIMSLQESADKKLKVARRERTTLSKDFADAYRKDVLDKFNMEVFITQLQWIGAKRIVLFCVEENETACHRGIVADRLNKDFTVTHL